MSNHKPGRTLLCALSAALLLAAAASPANADRGRGGVIDSLYKRGYYDIRITDRDDDEFEVLACRGGKLYELEIDRHGRIDDRDRVGRCGPGHARRGDVDVRAPYTGVHVGRGDVDVRAPYTGVHVDRDGVRVRAPFVDLHVPRRR